MWWGACLGDFGCVGVIGGSVVLIVSSAWLEFLCGCVVGRFVVGGLVSFLIVPFEFPDG